MGIFAATSREICHADSGTPCCSPSNRPIVMSVMSTDSTPTTAAKPNPSAVDQPPPSFVKLAMRNMVKKGGTSLYHFFLSSAAMLALLVGLAYLTR